VAVQGRTDVGRVYSTDGSFNARYRDTDFTTALENWTASPFPDFSSHDPMQNVGGIQFDMLRPWQQHVANWFSKPAGIFDRQIHWIWDAEGNTGKSVAVRYLASLPNGILASVMLDSDALYTVERFDTHHGHGPNVIVINIPRGADSSKVDYATLELLKDGAFQSDK